MPASAAMYADARHCRRFFFAAAMPLPCRHFSPPMSLPPLFIIYFRLIIRHIVFFAGRYFSRFDAAARHDYFDFRQRRLLPLFCAIFSLRRRRRR
jgi:hypothetical protein